MTNMMTFKGNLVGYKIGGDVQMKESEKARS
jgi:hypothetical protein